MKKNKNFRNMIRYENITIDDIFYQKNYKKKFKVKSIREKTYGDEKIIMLTLVCIDNNDEFYGNMEEFLDNFETKNQRRIRIINENKENN